MHVLIDVSTEITSALYFSLGFIDVKVGGNFKWVFLLYGKQQIESSKEQIKVTLVMQVDHNS